MKSIEATMRRLTQETDNLTTALRAGTMPDDSKATMAEMTAIDNLNTELERLVEKFLKKHYPLEPHCITPL